MNKILKTSCLIGTLAFLANLPTSAMAQQVTGVIDGTYTPQVQASVNPWSDVQSSVAAQTALPAQTAVKADIVSAPEDRDIWEAAADGNWPLVDELVSQRQVLTPGWQPPASLAAMRQRDESERRIEAASAISGGNSLIAAAAKTPEAFDCDHANNLWRLADAHLAVKNQSAAIGIYQRAIVECKAPDRFAAIQKIRAIVPLADMPAVLNTPGIAKDEREAVMLAEVEKTLADMKKKPAAKADPMGKLMKSVAGAIDAAAPGTNLPEIYGSAADKADQKQHAKLAEMLGWLQHKRQDEVSAAAWFRKAVDWGDSKDAKKGLIYALSASGEEGRRQAEAFATLWPGLVPLQTVQKDPALAAFETARDSRDWAACVALADQVKANLQIATSAAWCAFEAGNLPSAISSFKAIASNPKATDAEKKEAAKGWATAAMKAKDSKELQDLAALGLMPKTDADKLGYEVGMAQYWQLLEHKNYRAAFFKIQSIARTGISVSDEDRITAAWAAFNAGICGKASSIFNALKSSSNEEVRTKANKGIRILRGSPKADEKPCGQDNSSSWLPSETGGANNLPAAKAGDPLL